MLSEEEQKAVKVLKINPKIIADLDAELLYKMFEFEGQSIDELKEWAYKIVLNLITRLQRINEEKDRQIKALVKYIDSNNYITSNSCEFQDDFKIEKCIDEGNCKDCIRKYFEEQTKN